MNRLQYLLSKLNEECNEVGKEALKASYFGMDERYRDMPTNRERINNELNDVMGIIKMLNEEYNLDFQPDFNNQAVVDKIEKVNYYYRYGQSLGTIAPDEEK